MNNEKLNRPVINMDEVVIEDRAAMFQPSGPAAARFGSRSGAIGTRIGARLLGYNITVVPPGRRAFPAHNHHANEEMFFVLHGTGELRVGEERFSIRTGDFIASPPGGPGTAHQIINTGSEELRYLAVSTMIAPDLVEYPDSGKVGTYVRERATDGSMRLVRLINRPESNVDYWDGE